MFNIRKMKIRQLTIALIFCISVFPVYAQETLTFSTVDHPVRNHILKEILTEAYSELGININIMTMPARRGIIMANNGEFDGEVGRLKHIAPTFPNLLIVPVPIYNNKMVAFTKIADIQIGDWKDMRPYRVATMAGLKYTESKLLGFKQTYLLDTLEQAFIMLNLGRVDMVACSLIDGQNIINKLSIKGTRSLLVEQNPSYHYIHKKHRKLLRMITKSLKEMEQGGRIQEIAMKLIKKEGPFVK